MRLTTGKKRGFVIQGSPEELFEVACLPGAVFRESEGVVRMPESVSSWKVLRELEFDVVCPTARDSLKSLRTTYRNHRRQIQNASRRFKLTGKTDIPVPLKTVPYSHQVRAFGFASSIPECALYMDQGTGKTMVAIAVMGKRYLDNQVKRVLVISPKSAKPVWPRELRKHARFPWNFAVDKEPRKGRGVQVWVTNYDKVRSHLKKLKSWKPDLIILDECHRVKNRKASRTKACITLGAKIPFKMILSGTPFGKCISEVWSQFRFLNPSIFGSNYSQFKNQYLKMGGYMGYKVVGYKNQDEFSDKLHSIAFRVTKEECLDLPPLSYQRLYVDSDPKTRKIYSDLDLEMFGEVDGEEVSADLEITKQMKLRQIVGGVVKTDGETLAHVSNLKMSAVKEFLEDRAGKTVIFFSFTHEIYLAEKMCKELGLGYITLQGSTKNRDDFETRFQQDPALKVALIQIQTGSEALTLTAADVVMFYSPTFSYINYSQARDRIYRIGQVRPVTVVFVIMKETVDETVVDVLECNRQLIDEHLETRRNYNLKETEMSKYTAAMMAEELKVTPAELRKALRGSGAKKPGGGWNWDSKKDAAAVTKQVRDHLANAKTSAKPAKAATKVEKPAKAKKSAAKAPAKKAPRKAKRAAAEATAE